MRTVIPHLNYLAVLVVTIAGFLLGWLWYGVLFGKMWMVEMKIDPEKMKEDSAKKGMAGYFIQGLIFTFLGTFGLAALVAAHGAPNWKHGAALGMFIGLFVSSMRQLNTAVWENKSVRLRAINASHEIALFTLQGAILGVWR